MDSAARQHRRLRRRACAPSPDRRGIRTGCDGSVSVARSPAKNHWKPVRILHTGRRRVAGSGRGPSVAGSSETAEHRRTGKQIHAGCLACRTTAGVRFAYTSSPTVARRSGDSLGQGLEGQGDRCVLAGSRASPPGSAGRNDPRQPNSRDSLPGLARRTVGIWCRTRPPHQPPRTLSPCTCRPRRRKLGRAGCDVSRHPDSDRPKLFRDVVGSRSGKTSRLRLRDVAAAPAESTGAGALNAQGPIRA